MIDESELLKRIQNEAGRIVEDTTYSSSGHFEASKPLEHINLWLGIPLIFASTAAAVSALKDMPALASAIAFAVAGGTALMTFLSPQQRQKCHADCGNAYAALRNEVRIFRFIECSSGLSAKELCARLKEFDDRRNELNASSPIIPERAFKKARRGIEEGQKTHEVDLRTDAR